MELRAAAPGPLDQGQREVAGDGGDGGHQDGAQARHRPRAWTASTLDRPRACSQIGELDHQDAVLGDQADQRDQAHLRVDVQRGGPALGEPEGHPGRARELQEREYQRTEHRQRHRASEHHDGIPERVELRGQHQEDEHDGQAHGRQELAPLLPQLPGLAGVVEAAARGQQARRRRFQHAAARLSSDCGATPEIFTAFSCWKRLSGARLDARSGSWRSKTAGSVSRSGPLTWISASSLGVRRPARSIWAITL